MVMELSLHFGEGFKDKVGAVGGIITVVIFPSQPQQATLLSEIKCNVIKLSELVTVPGPTDPLHFPISVALVSLPSKMRRMSLSFSVQKLVNFIVIFFAPG